MLCFLNYFGQEMEAKHFAYLVQTQKKEYLKGQEEVRLPSVRITIVWGEGKGKERPGS